MVEIRKSRDHFTSFLLLVSAALVVMVSLPYMGNLISRSFGIDPLAMMGNGSILGPKKITLFQHVIFAAMAAEVAAIAVFRPRLGLHTLSLLVGALAIPLSMMLWLQASPYGERGDRLEFGRLSTVDYWGIFDSDQAFDSFDEFYRFWEARRLGLRDELKGKWHIDDEETYTAIFFLNVASDLFPYGNRDATTLPGCVLDNEQGKTTPGAITARAYLGSAIGCCSDYADVLLYLLQRAGMTARKVMLDHAGHAFNEVLIGGKWFALDPTIGVFYERSWEEVVMGDGPVRVIGFPVISGNVTKPEYFRPMLSKFRRHFLQWAVVGGERGRVEDTLPDYFKR